VTSPRPQPLPLTVALLLASLLGVLATTARSAVVQESGPQDFATAVEAYRGGDYDQALEQFAALADAEADAERRALLRANAGTAAARTKRWGEAIWHLEAARRGLPDDPAVSRNLEQVRARVGLADDETTQFTSTLRRLPLAFTERQMTQLVGALVAVALLLLAGWRVELFGRRLAWTALVLGVVALALHIGGDLARAWDARRAVVLDRIAVRAEPEPSGRVLFHLSPGTVVSDEEQRDAWRLVETSSGARGWAPAAGVRPAGS